MAEYRVPVLEKFVWQPPVKDKDLSSPPGSPSKGDSYIVAATGSGGWSGHTADIATYDGATWVFVTKTEGLCVWVEDEDLFYKYDGSNWSIGVGPQGLTGAQGLTGPQGITGPTGSGDFHAFLLMGA